MPPYDSVAAVIDNRPAAAAAADATVANAFIDTSAAAQKQEGLNPLERRFSKL
jgi:hypothetical protein